MGRTGRGGPGGAGNLCAEEADRGRPAPPPPAVAVPTLLLFLFSFLLPVDAVVPVVEARGDGEGLAPPGAVAMLLTPLPPPAD